MKAQFDLPKLARNLKKASREFGDTTAQGCTRWGVQVCREMAKSTQVFGTTKTRGKQEGAMLKDALRVILVQSGRPKSTRRLRSIEEVNDWIDQNRRAKNKRTRTLPINERKLCEEKLLMQALKARYKLAGIAKGGWLGAGQQIAAKQTGGEKVAIGKNYLSYAQKHASFGSAALVKNLFSPNATLRNKARHTASRHVTDPSAIKHSIGWGAKKTLTWYNKALKRKLDAV